ncbi:hypothetical protein PYCC9005_001974 [Savitreella phatthalungensis]
MKGEKLRLRNSLLPIRTRHRRRTGKVTSYTAASLSMHAILSAGGMFRVPVSSGRPRVRKRALQDRERVELNEEVQQAEASGSATSESEDDADAADNQATPVNDEDDDDLYLEPRNTLVGQRARHLQVLTELVHRLMLSGEWERAFSAYSLLLRTDKVDVRLCYSQGVVILDHIDLTGEKACAFLQRLAIAHPAPTSRRLRGPVGSTASAAHAGAVPGKADPGRKPNAHEFVRDLARHRSAFAMHVQLVDDLDEYLLVPPFSDDLELWTLYRNAVVQCQSQPTVNAVGLEMKLNRACERIRILSRT